MGNKRFNPAAPKKSANLSINLSQTRELHLAEIVCHAKKKQWLAENKNAIEEYNRRIETCGTFSDGLRQF